MFMIHLKNLAHKELTGLHRTYLIKQLRQCAVPLPNRHVRCLSGLVFTKGFIFKLNLSCEMIKYDYKH